MNEANDNKAAGPDPDRKVQTAGSPALKMWKWIVRDVKKPTRSWLIALFVTGVLLIPAVTGRDYLYVYGFPIILLAYSIVAFFWIPRK